MEATVTCVIRRLTPHGLEAVPYTASSLADAAQYEPRAGVYTITNTYHTTQVLKLDAHLDRLEDSARREEIPLVLDRPRLRAALRELILESGFGDVRFRVTVPKAYPDTLILSIESFKPLPPEMIAHGVQCATLPNKTRHNPGSKNTEWMHQRKNITLPAGAYEGLLLDSQGTILEGLSSNFYAVIEGALYTASEGVLAGIAQQIVFEVTPRVMPLVRKAVRVIDIPRFSEAFITSSSRGVVPVVRIDGAIIGDGMPGGKTMSVRHEYLGWVNTHLEEL
jgi:branched-chain amino acid aminotransferase